MLKPVDEEGIRLILEEHPDCPHDFLQFLRKDGAGEIAGLMIYNGMTSATEIFDPETAAELKTISFFADDFQGVNYGFDQGQKWSVVEVDSATPATRGIVARTFQEFLRRRIELSGTDI